MSESAPKTDQIFLGMMSGTSMDAVDAAAFRFSSRGATPTLVGSLSTPYPEKLKKRLLALINSPHTSAQEAFELDVLVGEHFGCAAASLLKQEDLLPSQVAAIGSHGQTIFHQPATLPRVTVQIGDPNRIVARTGCDVVADFRRADLAAGGEGAPLAPLFHAAFFMPSSGITVLLNLGGIANISILDSDAPDRIVGFDTGPANTLLDQWCLSQTGLEFDYKGAWARSGVVIHDLLERMLADPYFTRPAPKSTGREYFNQRWLTQFQVTKEAPADIQRTLLELTAKSVREALTPYISRLNELIVCGGGANNQLLMERLQAHLGNISCRSSSALGVAPQWVECAGFAWLARATMEKRAVDLSHVTGSHKPVVLGGIYQAAR